MFLLDQRVAAFGGAGQDRITIDTFFAKREGDAQSTRSGGEGNKVVILQQALSTDVCGGAR